MVFAKRKKAAQRLAKLFERRVVVKTYLALVSGAVEPKAGEWRDYMRKVPAEPRAEIVSADATDAKQAILHYEVESLEQGVSQLRIKLETGRMHQIRVQTASRGHAILGDQAYGSQRPFGPQTEDYRLRSIALHARTLRFMHPKTRAPIEIIAPLPSCWDELSLPKR